MAVLSERSSPAQVERSLQETESGIFRFMQQVSLMKAEVDDEEIDGWLIRRPSIFEFDDHFGVLLAQSRPGCSTPLILPQSVEICVAVIDGEIRLDGYAGGLSALHFFVVRPKDGRNIYAVTHPTKIAALFFRGPDSGPAQDLRAVA